MKLTDYLPPNLIQVPLKAADKTEAITALVDLLARQGHTEKRDLVLEAVLEREAQATTCLGCDPGLVSSVGSNSLHVEVAFAHLEYSGQALVSSSGPAASPRTAARERCAGPSSVGTAASSVRV